MRIDAANSLTLDRAPRPGRVVTPVREVQGEYQPVAREPRRAESGSYRLPVSLRDEFDQQRPLDNRAAQALASYASTASLSVDIDAPEVLGIDLYA
ncbi:hypothetical protein [Pseudomonas schmalbachii]|uniref:Uncharacterized protein n=1 Tax=Pseudomonas schmalbachii TaxID=2816993 RepID=A0ABS3TMA6_9PSED|nr:hypothetical protein [Pseudomonas schmalbachii]MBO3274795.1 hypothetical protein [Pseudomonas schmalbachii]